jgi:fimbrial isopeptide formation D2 family protein
MSGYLSKARKRAAALLCALLMLCAGTVPAMAQSIDNTAHANWDSAGQSFSTASNLVSIPLIPTQAKLEILGVTPSTGTQLSISAPICGGVPSSLPGVAGSGVPSISAAQTSTLRIGEVLYFRVNAAAANRNPAEVETLTTVLTTTSGDREELTIFESGPNTGIFLGAIPTSAIPPQPAQGDCKLSVDPGDRVEVSSFANGEATAIAIATVEILADPYGLVFDSEDGTPVNGARVSLVDAATGQPARVFADDGVTPYPSTIFTGQEVVDAAGNRYQMPPGEYRFPLAPIGQYRVVVEPPAPYSAPSISTPAQLAGLVRPDGMPMQIVAGSYGDSFALNSPAPVRIDIPVDRPLLSVSLSKSASRTSAEPGDVVFYTITARNPDNQRAKRQVVLNDTPSHWLRLRRDSIRLDGAPAPAAVTVSADGRSLTIQLGDLAPGAVRVVTYAMTVRGDTPPGQAINRVETVDARGNVAVASAALKIERETIAGRMTVIGRVTQGDCTIRGARIGIAGVRIMMEDGSFAITDADGRYHFEGVTPGTHVVQAQAATLPAGGRFIDCSRSTRNSKSANSRFVTGWGGSLKVADFFAIVPEQAAAATVADKPVASDRTAAGAETDWLKVGNGPIDWLFPTIDHNPRAPAVRVVIRHRPSQKVELSADGKPVDPLAFDGARSAPGGAYAVSAWRGIPLKDEVTQLVAVVRNADGTVAAKLERAVHFASLPVRAQLVSERSRLVADGSSRPVVAVKLIDRYGRPVHAGISGQFAVNAPYESAQVLDALQSRALSGLNRSDASWTVKGDDGIALIELAPTMVSGSLRLEFSLSDGNMQRKEMLEAWIVPGDQKWTLVGLAEGSVGEQSVADNMQRRGRFDSDLGKDARVAFYAKGRVLGRHLLTMSYDSAKQEDDQRLHGAIDPRSYYTVYADASDRRFDAASREKLYVRIESSKFYALYGDFDTGFDQTQLARYQRTATGVKAELRTGVLHAQGFAAKIASTHRRDEIQGGGITGPYRLASRSLIANSETVTIEVRDRFRSELVIERRNLSRFIDYDIDMLAGTITFKEPLLSRDASFNPQFVIVEYEVDGIQGGKINAGLRVDVTAPNNVVRAGATVITDTGAAEGNGERAELVGMDLKARIGANTEVRVEGAISRRGQVDAQAWLVEVEHQDGRLDVLGYARAADQGFGLGQLNGAERGRRKIGADARYKFTENWSISGSAWRDDSLSDTARRQAFQFGTELRRGNTDGNLTLSNFDDRLADGTSARSTVLEGGVRQRLFDNRLELEASSSVALGKTESIDLPNRHRFGLRYSLNSDIRLVAAYEFAEGDEIDARSLRAGFELAPWTGAKIATTFGQQNIAEQGKRSFAAFGLAQSYDVSKNLTVDASIDGSKTLGGIDPARVINPEHPVASGGHLGRNGSIGEDFTAYTLGATWRKDRWTATLRGEVRDGKFDNRRGMTFGAIRQLGEGSMAGAGFTWTRSNAPGGASAEIFSGALAVAHRPADSRLAFLSKVELRSDEVTGAVVDLDGPVGRTALNVTGDAKSRRVIGSVSANWSPRGCDDSDSRMFQRSEVGVFAAARHNFDRYQGFDLAGTTLMGGLDLRIGLGERIEIGGTANVRRNLSDHTTDFSFGPQIGISPAKDMLLLVGYNLKGYRDRDFAAARTTQEGLFATFKMKFDANSFDFLELGR